MEPSDRETALLLYEKIIDSAENESVVLSKLVSPTRQAVNIARAYDASQRRAAIEEGDAGTPPFVEAILNVGRSVLDGIEPAYRAEEPKQQIEAEKAPSYVTDEISAPAPAPEAESAPAVKEQESFTTFTSGEEMSQRGIEIEKDIMSFEARLKDEVKKASETLEEKGADAQNSSEEMGAKISAAVAAIAQAVDSTSGKNMSDIIEKNRDIYEDVPATDYTFSKTETAFSAKPAAETIEEEKKQKASELEDFVSKIDVLDEISAAEKNPEDDSADNKEKEEEKALFDKGAAEKTAAVEDDEEDDEDYSPRRKVKVGLLILYILIAVPVCALLTLLILALAVALLLAAFAVGKVAVLGIGSAFGNYAVFSDILAVTGVSFVILALALLLAWTAIWLVSGVIVSLIRGAIRLAGRWCYEEVDD